MAKNAGRLAGLAALAGAAYMMSRGKGKSDDAGDQKTSSYTKDTKKVESDGVPLKTPAQSIAAADKSDKSTSISTKGESGTTTPGPDKSVPRLDTEPNKPVKPAPAPKVEPKVVATDTKTTSVVPGGAKKRTEGNEPMPSLKAVEAKVASNRTDAMRNASRKTAASNTPKPAPTPVKDTAVSAAKAAVNTAVQGPASAVKPLVDKVVAKSGSDRVPTSEQAAANRQAAYDKIGNALSSPFRAIREAGNRGNPDTKMASGGMTASRRGDGIASRGKTKCKMY